MNSQEWSSKLPAFLAEYVDRGDGMVVEGRVVTADQSPNTNDRCRHTNGRKVSRKRPITA
jgi:hypothetical protein